MKRVNEFLFESDETTALLPSSAPAAAKSCPLSLRVKVSQVVDAEFGGFLWPSSHPLAWWLWIHANEVKGKRILEVILPMLLLVIA